jgi:RNA polymerase sigma-70 factor, ECF subfamily
MAIISKGSGAFSVLEGRYQEERNRLTRFFSGPGLPSELTMSAMVSSEEIRHELDAARPLSREHPTASSLLLEGVQRMDPAAWSRLVDTFGGIVYGWCRASGVTPADAEDVVQEVFASVARAVDRFQREKPEGSFRSWLATITRNRVRDHFRRQMQREVAAGGTDALRRLEEQAERLESTICTQGMESLVLQRVLDAVRMEFEPQTWSAFWKCAIDGLPAADVAEITGLSVASVYQAKSRVLRRLRQRLSELP